MVIMTLLSVVFVAPVLLVKLPPWMLGGNVMVHQRPSKSLHGHLSAAT